MKQRRVTSLTLRQRFFVFGRPLGSETLLLLLVDTLKNEPAVPPVKKIPAVHTTGVVNVFINMPPPAPWKKGVNQAAAAAVGRLHAVTV